ncbi:MAG TPA: hypothetical protein DCQ72_04350, partial [Methylophilaceae bacterium]|nr:hypothetical protein [Methylophilaceae bacterium]
IAEIKIQSTQWNNFRTKTAEAVADSPKINTPKTEGQTAEASVIQSQPTTPTPRIKLTGDTLGNDKNSKEIVQKEINQINDDKTALEKNIKDAEQKISLLEKELADAKKILAVSNQALFELQEKSKQVNQTKDLPSKEKDSVSKAPQVESKPDLNSLISKPSDMEASKNDSDAPHDASFKSSISDGANDEKANAQLAADKEVSSVSSSSGLFIFLGILFVILIMLFVIKTKKQQEQKNLIDSLNLNKEKSETPPVKQDGALEDIDLSGIEINLSEKDQKPTHSD